MKITRTLSKRCDHAGRRQVMLRLTVDHRHQHRLKSGIHIPDTWWHADGTISAGGHDTLACSRAAERLAALEARIYTLCAATPPGMLNAAFIREQCGLTASCTSRGMAGYALAYASTRSLSESRSRQYATLARMLARFEQCCGHSVPPECWNTAMVDRFVRFLTEEYKTGNGTRPRGHNTMCSVVSRVRTVVRYAAGRLGFEAAPIASRGELYGTPFFLSACELLALARADMSSEPRLSAQRDIFVFQCLTGLRLSDLRRLRPDSVCGGVLEYVAQKTRNARPEAVRVPLHPLALAIVRRLSPLASGGRMLPCVAPARYNRYIRTALELSGITRVVTVLDPLTLCEQHRRICDVASSHIARRTFIGNLYRTAKDPCLVSSMSGHKDGSKSFARYRSIDDSLKADLIMQTFLQTDMPAAPIT